jgi:hypothetical protein
MRGDAGYPRFQGLQKSFSDFTYEDRLGLMKETLQKAGVKPNPRWSKSTTFHLEVKTSLGGCDEACFISQNQVDMVCKYICWKEGVALIVFLLTLG